MWYKTFCLHGKAERKSDGQSIMAFASRQRPFLLFDATDGSPKITVDALAAEEPASFGIVMSMLEKIAADGKTCMRRNPGIGLTILSSEHGFSSRLLDGAGISVFFADGRSLPPDFGKPNYLRRNMV
jgi:hypothetical protein